MIENFLEKYDSYFARNDSKIILDIGSRDGLQSLEFAAAFPNANIYAFECNPDTIPICIDNCKKFKSISIIEKAVSDKDGEISFFPIDLGKNYKTDTGFSSIFKKNKDWNDPQIQKEIKVLSTRLDTWAKQCNIPNIDIIWMDIQGAELLALHGLGEYINNIKIIQLEASLATIYDGQCFTNDIEDYLIKNKFKKIYNSPNLYSDADLIFINERYA
jgi:FkbM family methyltransferase